MVWTLLSALIIGLAAILPATVKALPQRAITLLYFRGTGQNNAILLEWATATEFETAGFILQRANSESGPYNNLDQIGFIPGEGDGIIGAEYAVTDTMNIVNGQTYWYILVEIETSGAQNPTDPISVTGGEPTATPTATQTASTAPTTNSQGTSTPTSSPTASPTSSPTATAQSASTATPTSTQSSNGSSSQATATPTTSTSSSNSSNSSSGNGNVVEASSPTDPYPVSGTPSPTFVPDPNSATEPEPVKATEAYPAGNDLNESYPAATETNGQAIETPFIQPQGGGEPNSLSTQPPLEPPVKEDPAVQSSSTLFLWVGFTAALLIFAGGIIGSIFLFTRRSNQK